jgi:PAS domain S-box-containing protein
MDDAAQGVTSAEAWLAKGGEMAALVRVLDWGATPLGPISSWPQPLRTAVQAVLEAGVPMAVYWGADLTLVYNDRWRELLGAKHPTALGCPAREVFPEVWAEVRVPLECALRGDAVTAEDRLFPLDRDGTTRDAWFTFSASPIRMADGSVGGVLNLAVETTKRVATEARLREGAARNAFLLALDERLRGLHDPDGMTRAAAEMLGRRLGASWVGVSQASAAAVVFDIEGGWTAPGGSGVSGAHGRAAHGTPLAARLRSGQTVVVGDVSRSSEPMGDAEILAAICCRALVAVPLVGAGPLTPVLLVLDERPREWTADEVALIGEVAGRIWAAVERARADAALREGEARFRLMADAIPQIVWQADAEGRLDFLNRQWTHHTGASADEAANATGGWTAFVHPDDLPRTLAAWQEARGKVEAYHVEHRIRSREGEWRWFLVRAEPQRDPATGRALRWFGTSTDIHQQREAEAALRESEARLLLAQEAAGIGVYERDLRAGRALWSPAMFSLWGIDPEGRSAWVTDDEYLGLLVPEDEEVHRARRRARMDDPAVLRFSSEFRIRRRDSGEVRWIASRGEYVRDGSGRAVLARGTNQDITDRRVAEDRQAFLAREVDHRAKNALAVVQSVVQLTPADDPAAFKRGVQGRISALARAQTLLAEDRWRGADLHALLEGELAPFRSDRQRVTLDGAPVRLPPGMAQPMAMAFHELATNAVKHGALSVERGDLRVAWRLEEDSLHLTWRESGGPTLAAVPERRGFGSRVLQATVAGQLGGRVSKAWKPDGLSADLVVQLREGKTDESPATAGRGA